MPMTNSTYKHAVKGECNRDDIIYGDHRLDRFVNGDQLMRGAALNAYEIMQLVSK